MTLTLIAEAAFYGSACLLFTAYAGYPLFVAAAAAVAGRGARKSEYLPSCSFIVAARNEALHIGAKLENTLALDYPPDRLEIIVALDRCQDATPAIVAGYAGRGVKSVPVPPPGGKWRALDAAVTAARGEILVFSDANARLDAAALKELMRNFADPEVGSAFGRLTYRTIGAKSSGEGLFRRYENFIRRMESRLGSAVFGEGSLHALRRTLYAPGLPDASDDVLMSFRVIAAGRRNVYEPLAASEEGFGLSERDQLRRRARMVSRFVTALAVSAELLNPLRHGAYAWQLWFHKMLVLAAPALLATALVSNAALAAGSTAFGACLAAQAAFYLAAAAGGAASRLPLPAPLKSALYAPRFFVLAHAAVLAGLWLKLTRRAPESWDPVRAGEGR